MTVTCQRQTVMTDSVFGRVTVHDGCYEMPPNAKCNCLREECRVCV